jgi:hypothetical protein
LRAVGVYAIPAVETYRLAEQQSGDYPAQQHQVALVGEPAMLTQGASCPYDGVNEHDENIPAPGLIKRLKI